MKLQLRSKADDAWVESLVGTHAKPTHAKVMLAGDCDVFKPNGQRLISLRRGAISEAARAAAYPFLHGLRKHTTYNRGAYAGRDTSNGHKNVDPATGRRIKGDGTLAKTLERGKVASSVVGFMDRYPRTPFCRECALSSADPAGWGECLPLIQEVSKIFESVVPDRFHKQLTKAKETHPAYVIAGTPFTTLTVNNTTAGAYHRDAGDYIDGFGVMLVLRAGTYRGCDLVMPAFGVGVDLQDCDLILFDVHEVHGNVPISDAVGLPGSPLLDGHERISIVFYYRQNMAECLSPAEERERAKNLRGSLEPE